MQDDDGDENWHVYAVDLETGETKDLTPIDGVAAQIEGVERALPRRDPRRPQRPRRARSTTSIASTSPPASGSWCKKNAGFAGFVIDDDFQVRFAMQDRRPTAASELLTSQPDGDRLEADDKIRPWPTR